MCPARFARPFRLHNFAFAFALLLGCLAGRSQTIFVSTTQGTITSMNADGSSFAVLRSDSAYAYWGLAFDANTQQLWASRTDGSFNGSITDGTHAYAAELSGIVTSYATHGNTIPAAGRLMLSGTSIRTTIIEFAEESPATGKVQVSVDGGPFFEWTLPGFER